MEIEIFDKKEEMGAAAAVAGIAKLKEVLAEKGLQISVTFLETFLGIFLEEEVVEVAVAAKVFREMTYKRKLILVLKKRPLVLKKP